MDPFIGEIRMFTGTFAPAGWLYCWGQTLSITQYQALYAVIGTQFGGNGSSNFMLPDMRGRVPLCAGAGTNLTTRTQGQYSGYEKVGLQVSELATHNHVIANEATATTSGLTLAGSATLKCSNTSGNTQDPTGAYPAKTKALSGDTIYTNDATKVTGTMNSAAIQLNGSVQGNVDVEVNSICQITGSGSPHENMQPWLCLNFIIAIEGIFPPRP